MTGITKPRVVITGLGVVSPIGCDLLTVWKNLSEGRSGIRPITSLPMQSLPFQSGGECVDFTGDIEDYGVLDKQLQRAIKKNSKVMCREIEMGVAAAQKALLHSGLVAEIRNPDRCGVLFGSDYILTRPEEYADGVDNCRDEAREFHVERWPAIISPAQDDAFRIPSLVRTRAQSAARRSHPGHGRRSGCRPAGPRL